MSNMLRSRQMNPLDPYFWKCKGYAGRPHNWRALLDEMGYYNGYSSSESEDDLENAPNVSNNKDSLRSRQLNPCDNLFWKSRGYAGRPDNWEDLLDEMGYYNDSDSESDDDSVDTSSGSSNNDSLRSRQLNPCDDLFWKSRGYTGRPSNWRALLEDMGYYNDDNN